MQKIIKEITENHAKMLIQHWQTKFEKNRTNEIEKFNNNCEHIRFNLNVILNTYLPKRKEKYLLSARKIWFGHVAPLQGINTNYADYFSKKDSDLWSMEIFEDCMLGINKIVDFESVQQVLKKLSNYYEDALKSSTTQSDYIKLVINQLKIYMKPCLNFIETDEDIQLNEIVKNIIQPLNLFLNHLINIINEKIQLTYHKIQNKYLIQATKIFNQYLRIRELKELIELHERYIYNSVKSAESDYIISSDFAWSPGPSKSEIKREGKKLYKRGLEYIEENKASQLEIKKLYVEIQQLQLQTNMPDKDLKFIEELVKLDWKNKEKIKLSISDLQFNNIIYSCNYYDGKSIRIDSKINPLNVKFSGGYFLSSPIFEYLTAEDLDEIKQESSNFKHFPKPEVAHPVNKNIFFYHDPAKLPKSMTVQKPSIEFGL